MANPNFGVFDLETMVVEDSKGNKTSVVFALGFKTNYSDNDLSLFYLTDYYDPDANSFNLLVIKCIDAMLVPKYNKFIFYIHNMGAFDAIFFNKILLDFNMNNDDKYLVESFYRDDKMIKVEISKTSNLKVKIILVDSYNLLHNSLDMLAKDFNTECTKGIFPYSFPNKYNLNYIGSIPNIKYYNKNIDMDLYNSLYTNN
jgi:hypothetical protein